MLFRLGLELADRIVTALPPGVAYRLADLGGDAWRRFAPSRRRLVEANLRRVCEATGRPVSGPAFRRLVRDAFRNHARYYLEIVRAPHFPMDRITEIVNVPRWTTFEPLVRDRASILVSWHFGNPEPFSSFLVAQGIRVLSPIEVIEPRVLFDFLVARRGAGHPELVDVRRAARPLAQRLRAGGMVGLVADRDLSGDGLPVTIFGHPTTMPAGPAWLALVHRVTLLAGSAVRVGPERFVADGELVELPDSGDRRADTLELTRRLAARFEADIAGTPEQWWGAFQPFWPDLVPAATERGA
jgi:KDO2-lipid IV(A) lauroyltransferase